MSAMERRLQLLLDEQRYGLVQAEAARSGRSVAAVIHYRFLGADERGAALEGRRLGGLRRVSNRT